MTEWPIVSLVILFSMFISGGFFSVPKESLPANTYTIAVPPPFGPYDSLQLSTFQFKQKQASCGALNIPSSEPGILYATDPIETESVGSGGKLKVWYSDEHALSLGYGGNGIVVTSSVTAPDHALVANVGDTAVRDCGNTAPGKVACQQGQIPTPVFPSLFLVDLSTNPSATPADAVVTNPHSVNEIFGEWKEFGAKNDPSQPSDGFSLGVGADPFPLATTNTNGPFPQNKLPGQERKYGAELIWNIDSLGLVPSNPPHNYLAVVVLHDGDNNNGIADVGIGCTTVNY